MLSTDKQTNQRYQKHNLLCQGGNKLEMQHRRKPALLYCVAECYKNKLLKKRRKFIKLYSGVEK